MFVDPEYAVDNILRWVQRRRSYNKQGAIRINWTQQTTHTCMHAGYAKLECLCGRLRGKRAQKGGKKGYNWWCLADRIHSQMCIIFCIILSPLGHFILENMWFSFRNHFKIKKHNNYPAHTLSLISFYYLI